MDYDFEAWAQNTIAQQEAASQPVNTSSGIMSNNNNVYQDSILRIGSKKDDPVVRNMYKIGGDDDDDKKKEPSITEKLSNVLVNAYKSIGESFTHKGREIPSAGKIYSTSAFVLGAKKAQPTRFDSMIDMPTYEDIDAKIDEMFSKKGQPYKNIYESTYDEVKPLKGVEEFRARQAMRDKINEAIKDVMDRPDVEYKDMKDAINDAINNVIKDSEKELTDTQAALRKGLGSKKDISGTQIASSGEIVADSYDPDREFYQSGISMDQREYAPETGFEGMGPDPSTGQPVQGLMSPTSTTLTAEQRTALSDMGSDVMRTNLQDITNSRGNYSQTALTNAIDKGIRNQNKKALLKGSIETELGERGLVTEGTGYRLNRAYEMFNDATVDQALESLPPAEQARIRNGAASNALGLAIMDLSYDGGSDYRGRGLVQLTHRENYQAVEDILESNGINIDLVNNPELANDTRYALPIAMAYLEHAGLDDTAAENSSAKDLNDRINIGANSTIANERWDNVVQALRDAGQDEEADRMENRNEYAAQETVETTVDGIIGPNSRAAMREWLNERNITIPQNATDMDLVVLVNENS